MNDAPQGVIVDAEIAVDQPVAGGDDEPPRNLRISRTHRVRDMGRCLSDQLKITQGRVVIQPAGNETCLIQRRCKR